MHVTKAVSGFSILLFCAATGFAQDQLTGSISGRVVLEATGDPMRNTSVLAVQLRRSVQTDDKGIFTFTNVAPGTYELVAHIHSLSDERKTVQVTAGGIAVVDFVLKIAPLREEVTVTASGSEETALETFQTVTSVESLELTQKPATSLGDVLDGQSGVAKRSSGPGTSRPVIRGFDGDRVLIMQDGVRTGTISSQSGDHGEPIDPNSVDKVEVVKGPATLLYGSNAMGGVVNIISSHHQIHQHPHEGMRGYLTGTGGTADTRGGGSGGFEYGLKNWLFWGDGGGQTAKDYASPFGRIANSAANITDVTGGVGHYGEKVYFSGGYGVYAGNYGIPYNKAEADAEIVGLKYKRQNVRFNVGVKNLGSYFDQFELSLNYSDWNHKEIAVATDSVSNEFFNKQFVYRGSFEQKKKGRFSGTLGFWGMHRDYKAVGAEAITPPTIQDSIAAFGLEQVQFKHFRLQFGARLENNRYDPLLLPSRSFTGVSASAGVSVPLWKGGVFVSNYSHTYRAPALEELYSYGPHAGNLTWEIGHPDLKRERGDGIDFSVRHQAGKIHAEANFFYYNFLDYVYLVPTGEISEGLTVADYAQANTRYRGAEARLDYHVLSSLLLNFGVDSVNAQTKATSTPLPRIPPLRGHVGFDWRYKNFSVQPEVVIANRQDRVFTTETETAGYAVFNVRASYTVTKQHALQMFSVNLYNAGDRLYRNHLSFIKEFAPEIGRGVQVSYTIRFF